MRLPIRLLLFLLLIPASLFSGEVPVEKADYLSQRSQLIQQDRSTRRSASLDLNENELRARAARYVFPG